MSQQSTRRITTGVTAEKQSKILADEQIEMFAPYPQYAGFQLQNLFYTEDCPQSLRTRHLDSPYNIDLPPGAFRFLKVRMPTKQEVIRDLKAAGQTLPEDWKTFNLHSTDSVDYIYVLSGEITCIVGTEELHLKAGDFLAQVGPEHTWINDHDEPCYFLCIMMGIHPSEIGKNLDV